MFVYYVSIKPSDKINYLKIIYLKMRRFDPQLEPSSGFFEPRPKLAHGHHGQFPGPPGFCEPHWFGGFTPTIVILNEGSLVRSVRLMWLL